MTGLRGLHLHVDCACGAAGDMMLGALLDLGVPESVVGDALDAIGAGRARLRAVKVVKAGIAATDVTVDTAGELPDLGGHVHAAAPSEIRGVPRAPAPLLDSERTQSLRTEDLARLVASATAPEPARHPNTLPRKPTGGDDDHANVHGIHSHVDHAHGVDSHAHSEASRTPRAYDDLGHAAEPLAHAAEPPANPDVHGDHAHVHGVHSHVDHTHANGHHAHRHYHYAAIRTRIVEAALTEGTRRRALDIFDRIARAEAKLHGSSIDDVAFHEVGAIDSVVDVVGTAAALDWLDPASVTCASVAMGHGTITCSHGVLPVPAPAALEVLREARGVMVDGGVARELCTPTGAAILAATVTSWAPAPAGSPVGVGWGAGDADLRDRANVLRVVAMQPVTTATRDAVWQIDANLDDMSPELCAPAAEAIFAAGALDVWWTPIMMKKGRPALALSALVTRELRDAVVAAILRETTTIGVRYSERERSVLARVLVDVTTRYGTIAIKLAKDGEAVLNAAPEYEACAAAARTHGVSVKLVYAAALAAYEATR